MVTNSKNSKSGGASPIKPLVILAIGLLGALGIAVYLASSEAETPAPAETVVALGEAASRIRGPADAPVTLVEFGDYQCPTCGAFHPIVAELMRRFPTELKLEYRHLPLVSIHPNALAASVAAEAAGEQGHYWEMHDMLFENQTMWSPSVNPEPIFVSYAERLGLDSDRFLAAFRSDAIQARILEDVTEARALAIGGTPTFFVNGRQLYSLPRSAAEFETIIREALEAGE